MWNCLRPLALVAVSDRLGVVRTSLLTGVLKACGRQYPDLKQYQILFESKFTNPQHPLKPTRANKGSDKLTVNSCFQEHLDSLRTVAWHLLPDTYSELLSTRLFDTTSCFTNLRALCRPSSPSVQIIDNHQLQHLIQKLYK
jgi:hypothetical protein